MNLKFMVNELISLYFKGAKDFFFKEGFFRRYK